MNVKNPLQLKSLFRLMTGMGILVALLMQNAQGEPLDAHKETALKIAENHKEQLQDTGQLLIAFNESPEDDQGCLILLERENKTWTVTGEPVMTYLGRNGFAEPGKKREGDGKTPAGLFRLGLLFTYLDSVDTRMPYLQSTANDKWVDDPESKDYNRHVRGETDARSYERLLLQSDAYKYNMVIEYNTDPVIKGHGSAIFIHLHGRKRGGTAGCLAIDEKDMKNILKQLDPAKKPSILMGNKSILLK